MLMKQRHYNRNLQRAWNKYGDKAFSYSYAEELGPYDRHEYFLRENWWMQHLRDKGVTLFNIAKAEGGWGPETRTRSKEIGQKISEGVCRTLSQPHVKAKMRLAKLGVKRTPEEKAKISEKLSGIAKSPETRALMSLAQKKRALENPSVSNRMAEVGKMNKGKVPANAVTFVINGVSYHSGKAAERALGITSRQLAAKVKDGTAKRIKETKEL